MLKRNVRKSIYGKLSEIRTKLKEDRLRVSVESYLERRVD